MHCTNTPSNTPSVDDLLSTGTVAPLAIFKAVQAAAVFQSFPEGLKKERELFEELVKGPQSKALQYFFFSERRVSTLPEGALKDQPTTGGRAPSPSPSCLTPFPLLFSLPFPPPLSLPFLPPRFFPLPLLCSVNVSPLNLLDSPHLPPSCPLRHPLTHFLTHPLTHRMNNTPSKPPFNIPSNTPFHPPSDRFGSDRYQPSHYHPFQHPLCHPLIHPLTHPLTHPFAPSNTPLF